MFNNIINPFITQIIKINDLMIVIDIIYTCADIAFVCAIDGSMWLNCCGARAMFQTAVAA